MKGQETELRRGLYRAGEAEKGQKGCMEQKIIAHFGVRAADVTAGRALEASEADNHEAYEIQQVSINTAPHTYQG